MKAKEEYAIVLDYLPHGYPLEKERKPIIQAIGIDYFTPFELVPKKDAKIEIREKVYIGEGKRDKIYYIKGKLDPEKLTETAKINLKEVVHELLINKPEIVIKFFNEAEAINKRLHSIELLPGFGKKHTKDIIKAREEKPFESIEDMKKRVKNLPDPLKAVEKRIIEELTEKVKYKLFTG
jgi:putative nucleotide binding protein